MTEALNALHALAPLAWPFAAMLAWLAGELGQRWLGLPRISVYGLVGFCLGAGQLGLLPAAHGGAMVIVAHVAFGLVLFEFGYRINLLWLRANPWLVASGVLEALATLVAVFALARAGGIEPLMSMLLAALAMSTSPVTVMRVVNERRCSGQVTERLLHLTAINFLLAVFTFKVVVGVWTFQSSGSVWQAASNSLVVVAVSVGLGCAFGLAVPALQRRVVEPGADATVAFALGVLLLVALAHAMKYSPVVAALAFGLVARHRRVVFSRAQRNFGALGDVLVVFLFVYTASMLDASRMLEGVGLAAALVGARLLTKTLGVTLFAHLSGVSWRKGFLSGLALAPTSVFLLLLMEQGHPLGIDLVGQFAALAAATLALELAGPAITQFALKCAGEATAGARRP
ncbi:MAG: cation:proton antiporter [Burkholderiales bacterium]|nr:cation:proton antiporter [Burkholderiales bacterium]